MTLRRKAPLSRGGRIKPRNVKRKKSEWARAYGSKARVAWVKAQPCEVVGCDNVPCENAHIETGGTGRKADYDKIVPLCRDHHRQSHQFGWGKLRGLYSMFLRELAAAHTQARWERYAEGE